MKIVWLCNMMLPQIAEHLGKPVSPLGGWLVGLMNSLLEQEDVSITVVFPNGTAEIEGRTEQFPFYGFAGGGSVARFQTILQKENPDVIHIFGTEYEHAYMMAQAAAQVGKLEKTVVNMQGLVSIYATHYDTKLPSHVFYGTTIRDFLRKENIYQQKRDFEKRGISEVKALQLIPHVIGRTDWDKACSQQINPRATYHFCNETLRDSFYQNTWSRETCTPYAIFLSQANNPIKGFHIMLEAMPEIIKRYPQAHIYVTGENFLHISGKAKLKQRTYPRYLAKLIRRYHLENKVTFLGRLDEQAMCQQYLKSHVFVSASSIENSPNSVGEAMLLGVPTVSSDVGGVKNMLTHASEGFIYQHDAAYMLAYYVCQIFADETLATQFSIASRKHASSTHSPQENLANMLKIYKEIGQ